MLLNFFILKINDKKLYIKRDNTMKIFKSKLIWLLLTVPMIGCVSIPVADKKDMPKQEKVVVSQPLVVVSNEIQTKPVDIYAELLSNSNEAKKEIQVENKNQEDFVTVPVPTIKSNVKPDPSVALIAPPTNLPKTFYAIPEVEGKEDYTPPVKQYKNKKVCKNGKCVTKRVSVSVGKVKKPVAKATTKSKTTKTTIKSKTTTKVKPKKDTSKK